MLPMLVVLLLVVALPTAYFMGRSSAPPSVAPTAPPAPPAELAERDAFIEQLRELAWQHRDVSPELSTIIIDEIARHHRRPPGGPNT